MKKIITGVLLLVSSVFVLATTQLNLFAAEELIDLYPRDNSEFATVASIGDANWVLEYDGYRLHNAKQSVTFVSRFNQEILNDEDEDIRDYDLPKTEFLENDVPKVLGSNNGGIIYNDTDEDIIIKVDNSVAQAQRRANLGSTITSRFWAYFDETGRLVMYEDEHVNTTHLTRVEGENYWRLSTQEEIDVFTAAPSDDKPEDMILDSYRIKLNDDGEGYKAEPVDLGWGVLGNDPENPFDSTLVDHKSHEVALPAGWTAVRFGENGRYFEMAKWAATFKDKIAAGSTETMELKYLGKPSFAGFDLLDDDADTEGTQIIIGNEVTDIADALTYGVEARFVTEKQDIEASGTGEFYDIIDYTVEIYEEETLLETIQVKYNSTTNQYEVPEFTKISTDEFGKEYSLRYKTTAGDDVEYEEKITVIVGTVNPEILGLENKYVNEGSYINLYEGIVAKDPNGLDITDNISITFGNDFNPNYPTIGKYDVTVTLNWLYESIAPNTFKYPSSVDANQIEWKFDVEESILKDIINYNYSNPSEAGRIPTMYDSTMLSALTTTETEANFKLANTITLIFDSKGVLVSKLDRFENDTPQVLLSNGTVETLETDYVFEDWLTENLVKGSYLLHIQGEDDATEARAIELGDRLVDFLFFDYFSQEVEVVRTFVVTVTDVTPPRVRVLSKNFTIYTDNNFESVEEALYSNIEVFETNEYSLGVSQVASRASIREAGETDVEVTVTDSSGNSTTARFKLIVKDVPTIELPEDNNDYEELLEDTILELEGKLQESIDSKTTLTTVLIFSLISVVLSIGTSVVMIIIKKK